MHNRRIAQGSRSERAAPNPDVSFTASWGQDFEWAKVSAASVSAQAPSVIETDLEQRPALEPSQQQSGASTRIDVGQRWTLWTSRSAPMEVLASFIGRVDAIADEVITARVVDQFTGAELDADFDLSDVDDEDRPLVVVGASFYWTLLRRQQPTERVSRLRFRRLPPAPTHLVDLAHEEARAFVALLGGQPDAIL